MSGIRSLIAEHDHYIGCRYVSERLSAELIADGAGVEITPEEIRDAIDATGYVLVRKFADSALADPVPGVRLVAGELAYSAAWL